MHSPVWVRLARDRRGTDRLELGPCPRCGDRNSTVRTRTDLVLYAACTSGHMWSLARPRVMWLVEGRHKDAS
jgi:hypothetical protein